MTDKVTIIDPVGNKCVVDRVDAYEILELGGHWPDEVEAEEVEIEAEEAEEPELTVQEVISNKLAESDTDTKHERNDLIKKKKVELLEIASEMGVETEEKQNNAQIISAILKAQA